MHTSAIYLTSCLSISNPTNASERRWAQSYFCMKNPSVFSNSPKSSLEALVSKASKQLLLVPSNTSYPFLQFRCYAWP